MKSAVTTSHATTSAVTTSHRDDKRRDDKPRDDKRRDDKPRDEKQGEEKQGDERGDRRNNDRRTNDRRDNDRRDNDRRDNDRRGNDRRGNDRRGGRNDRKDRYLSEPEEHGFNFDGIITAEGVLEIQTEGFGFLRSADYNYLNSPDDVYITSRQIKQYSLQTGDTVIAKVRPPRRLGEKFYPLIDVMSINGRSPEWVRDRIPFKFLTPLFPSRKVQTEHARRKHQHATHGPFCAHRQRTARHACITAKDG